MEQAAAVAGGLAAGGAGPQLYVKLSNLRPAWHHDFVLSLLMFSC